MRSLTSQTRGLPAALAEMKDATAEDWTDRMQKEEGFNENKFLRAGIEACQQGAALPAEADLLQDVLA